MVRNRTPVTKHTTGHMFHSLLMSKRSSCEAIMPNVFVHNWNECDALMVLRSGYVHEVEMKLTRSDFKADFKKTNWWKRVPSDVRWARDGMQNVESNKHDLLEQGTCFPNRFSFLVPDGLIDPDDVPPYAGLMYFRRYEGHYGHIKVIRQPKLLHKNKISRNMMLNLTKKFVWRHIDSIQPELEVKNPYGCLTEEHF